MTDEEKKKKAIERATLWRINNKEKRKKWEEENKEKRKIAKKEWIEKNREKVNKANSEWQKNNPDKVKLRNDRHKNTPHGKISRQASRDAYRKRCKEASMNRFDIKNITNIYRKCKELSILTGIKYHVDHIVPIRSDKVCGLHCSWNMAIITADDNLKKSNHFEE